MVFELFFPPKLNLGYLIVGTVAGEFPEAEAPGRHLPARGDVSQGLYRRDHLQSTQGVHVGEERESAEAWEGESYRPPAVVY